MTEETQTQANGLGYSRKRIPQTFRTSPLAGKLVIIMYVYL